MHYIKDATASTVKFLDHHLTPRFHSYHDNLNSTTAQKVADIAACTFVMLAGVVSFVAFPQLTLAGSVLGLVFRNQLRDGVAALWNTFQKVNIVAKAIILVVAFASWPYLYLAVPPIIGCYVGWQALDRSADDNHFLHPNKGFKTANSAA